MTRAALYTCVILAACGSEGEQAPAPDASSHADGNGNAGSSGTSDAGDARVADPCAPLENGTNLSGCVPMYCECADGTRTRMGGGCSNGVGTANCDLGCARNGGSGTARPLANIYSSPACLSYCRLLYGLGCGPSAYISFETSVSRLCSFLRDVPLPNASGDAASPAATCAEAARQNLECIVSTAAYECNGSGFSGPTQCGQANDVYDQGCTR